MNVNLLPYSFTVVPCRAKINWNSTVGTVILNSLFFRQLPHHTLLRPLRTPTLSKGILEARPRSPSSQHCINNACICEVRVSVRHRV